MALARNFNSLTGGANKVTLNWQQPLGFNNTTDELILTKTISHYPMELYNASFPTKATDSRPIEIFRGSTIVGLDEGSISVSTDTLTDTSASFPTSPSLKGRLLRDVESKVFRIVSNTATTLTVEVVNNVLPVSGKYVVLPDFQTTTRVQDNFELDIRTTVSGVVISNLVTIEDGSLLVKNFEQDELANLVFIDGNSDKFIIKSNTVNTVTLFGSTTPTLGQGMRVLNSHVDTSPLPYEDTYLNEQEAASRAGTGLQDDTYYYYTLFSLEKSANVAQAEFGAKDTGVDTQDFAISPAEKKFGERLYSLWPGVYRNLDNSEDLQDLMDTFGFFFDQLHALIKTYKLQDSDNMLVTALLPLSEQTGLPSVGFSIGADTLRRIAKDMIPCWKLKGTKDGIAKFIRKITTWDITNGTGEVSTAIQDTLPNVSALRFFDSDLGSTNTRITETSPLFTPGGRFARSLPGIVIPGFFTFREFVITLPEVALYIGNSTSFISGVNTTTLVDDNANFGAVNSLVGNFLLPNQEEVNDIFLITANTDTSITVTGTVNNKNVGGSYAVLSPLNTNRFIILNKLLPFYIPFGTQAGFIFT